MRRVVWVGLLGATLLRMLHAQGVLIVPADPLPPERQTHLTQYERRPVWLREHSVRVVIREQLAETTLEQQFVNESSIPLEAEYWFPVPRDVAVSGFTMQVDDRPVEAKLLPADEARPLYESFVRRQQDPALLEFWGHHLLRLRVFPIPAKGSRRLTLRYAQTLSREGGLIHYHLPLRATRALARPIAQLRVTVEVHTRAPLVSSYSPSHPEVRMQRIAPNRARFHWEAKNLRPERDFHLYFNSTANPYDLQVFTYRSGDDGYFMALLTPSPQQPTEPLPKHLIFVFDRTGSMAGEKLEQAKAAFRYCLSNLQPRDKFNLVVFSEQATKLFETLEPATPENVRRAIKHVDALEARGRTNLYEALQVAFQSLPVERTPALRAIVFLTDGLPTAGVQEPERILEMTREQNAHRAIRMFIFGVGYDVNVHLLDQLAQVHRGVADYVRPEEPIEAKVARFFDRISLPLLTDLHLRVEGVPTYDVYPAELPDLFAGDQLVIVGRYRGSGRATFVVEAQERTRKLQLRQVVALPGHSHTMDFLPRLWAVRKIGSLLNEWRLKGNEEVRAEIIRLAREYGVITPFTAFLIDKEMILADEARQMERALATPGGFGSAPATGRTAVDQSQTTMRLSMPAQSLPDSSLPEQQQALESLQVVNIDNALVLRQATERVLNRGERAFYRRGTQWIDSRYDPAEKLPEIEIAVYSDAYFQLLGRLPRLRPYLSIGEEVLLRLPKVVIKIGKQGKATLSEPEWLQIQGEAGSP